MAEQERVVLAVNGTLMRGLKLEPNMIAAGATFVEEARTVPEYRLWTIGDDEHPAMMWAPDSVPANRGLERTAVALELWSVPVGGLASILRNEPPGLCIGKVTLSDGRITLGVLGEAALCATRGQEITRHGGWRAYLASKKAQ